MVFFVIYWERAKWWFEAIIGPALRCMCILNDHIIFSESKNQFFFQFLNVSTFEIFIMGFFVKPSSSLFYGQRNKTRRRIKNKQIFLYSLLLFAQKRNRKQREICVIVSFCVCLFESSILISTLHLHIFRCCTQKNDRADVNHTREVRFYSILI